jgi:uncharacterized membrane protein YdbT with pleckstrin-like domain
MTNTRGYHLFFLVLYIVAFVYIIYSMLTLPFSWFMPVGLVLVVIAMLAKIHALRSFRTPPEDE